MEKTLLTFLSIDFKILRLLMKINLFPVRVPLNSNKNLGESK
ncbi:hypothetical protein LEP1GSC195_3924 [Leptospira wolbachii serovar Codice str. CDC]|uniref:Uncharacterized protein n=1 Tax=Leptospira wolbachii serovar Codice str. CDC TaxID=1218599 RepID=R9A5A6_9LEPT|nr:hypothetical protein LEP1GSC195_3924 [Leptospira wolbachii serovar Codice str. CDC]